MESASAFGFLSIVAVFIITSEIVERLKLPKGSYIFTLIINLFIIWQIGQTIGFGLTFLGCIIIAGILRVEEKERADSDRQLEKKKRLTEDKFTVNNSQDQSLVDWWKSINK